MKKIILSLAVISSISIYTANAQSYQVREGRCFADVNGDGMEDYIVVSGDELQPVVNVYYSNGIGFRSSADFTFIPKAKTKFNGDYFIVDVNGDGKSDFVSLQGQGSEVQIVAYLTSHRGFTNKYKIISEPIDKGFDGFPRGFVDINGDGKADFVTFRGRINRPYIVAYTMGKNGFNAEKSYSSSALLSSTVNGTIKAFADVNNDGLADFVESDDDIHLKIYPGSKALFASRYIYPKVTTLSSCIQKGINDMPRGFYDMDGDGRADYVTFDGDAENPNAQIYTSYGSLFIENPIVTRPVEKGSSAIPSRLADINGDGKWDYIAFRGDENRVKPVIYKNSGNGFIAPTDEMEIKLINDAAYNAYFTVEYTYDGERKKLRTPEVTSGESFEFLIPDDAYDVEVVGICNECYETRRIFTDLINRADNPKKICYRVGGTLSKKYWNYKCK